jgi:hypothetical protein
LKSDHFAAHILRKMIDLNPKNRISAKEIKNSLSKREIEEKRSSNFIKGEICFESKIIMYESRK